MIFKDALEDVSFQTYYYFAGLVWKTVATRDGKRYTQFASTAVGSIKDLINAWLRMEAEEE